MSGYHSGVIVLRLFPTSRVALAMLIGMLAGLPTLAASLADPRLDETSGIAASQHNPQITWAINDSGHGPELYAVGHNGARRGVVRVVGTANVDWEDLDSFSIEGQPYLLIADTGDNASQRRYSRLIIVAEPEPDERGLYAGVVKPVLVIPFVFEDGPRDCEAVAVSTRDRQIILLAKRSVPAPIYTLPLSLEPMPGKILTAVRRGTVNGLRTISTRELLEAPLGPWRHQPTALTLNEERGELALMTYQNLYVYTRADERDWVETLTSRIPQVSAVELSQYESITWQDGGWLTIPEGRNAPLLRLGR
ncbi:MAG: hypothetical protein HKN49_00885 [Gammaproteobacteria bacterium]|nr:hypothetical protein [Gammaproteobacteria bacterium]